MSSNNQAYTDSNTRKGYDEYHGQWLDTMIDVMDRNIEGTRVQLSGVTFMTKMEHLGIGQDTETIKSIVDNMPPHSILIYHKYGQQVAMYPERTGLLTVIKGMDKSRVQFSFTGFEFYYRGFYDNLRGEGEEFWSGWRRMIESGKDDTLWANRVQTHYLNSKDGRPIILQVSLDGNGQNLGYSGSKFEQVVAKNGYFDKLEVNGKVIG